MRLTASSVSSLYLEVFMAAEKECRTKNYVMNKEYCNYFDYKKIPEEITFYRKESMGQETAFCGRENFDSWDIIGHPDSNKILWDKCVITKLSSTLSESQIKEDMYFSFQKTKPFAKKYYSHKYLLQPNIN